MGINLLIWVNFLQIEKLEEGLADSEQQLNAARKKLSMLQADHTTTDTTITQLQETLQQQQQTIDRLVVNVWSNNNKEKQQKIGS